MEVSHAEVLFFRSRRTRGSYALAGSQWSLPQVALRALQLRSAPFHVRRLLRLAGWLQAPVLPTRPTGGLEETQAAAALHAARV